MTGDDAGALPLYEESREIFEELGDANAVGELIHRLAITYQQLGDDSRARPLAEEGLRFAERSGRRKLEAMSLRPLGVIEHHAGNVEIGIAHLIRAAEIAGEVGFRWWQEGCLSEAAYFALEEGRVEEAERWSRDALDLAFAIDDGQGLVYSLAQLAMVATARGEDRLAGFLWGATEAVAASVRPLGGWPTDAEEFAAAVIIESHDFQEGRIEGSRAGLPEAIDVALGRKPVEGVQ